jgi:HAE1 family hydrophobic/amphiphilic exporter-1
MMTTAAALMGGLPIALGLGAGGAARQPLGLAVVGGLIFSQTLTLYVTPVFFLYMEKLRQHFHGADQNETTPELPVFDASADASRTTGF